MVIGGSILPYKVKGQEGKLRAVAAVIEKPGAGKVCVVACDVLMLNRDLLDPVAEEVAKALGIPESHVLINCTHTHHAPSTVTIHGYERDELFCRRVQKAIVKAAKDANAKLKDGDATFHFRLGEESSVGQNSRLLLKDDTIFWIGPRDDAVRPTGPFDPELPVLAFRNADKKPLAVLFNHSTHTIGVRKSGPVAVVLRPGGAGTRRRPRRHVPVPRRRVRLDAQPRHAGRGEHHPHQAGGEGRAGEGDAARGVARHRGEEAVQVQGAEVRRGEGGRGGVGVLQEASAEAGGRVHRSVPRPAEGAGSRSRARNARRGCRWC